MRIAVRGARGERADGSDWSAPDAGRADWMTITVPRIWSETPLGEHVGTIWFRREIDLPAAAAGKPAAIRLGIVDDTDVTYVNGDPHQRDDELAEPAAAVHDSRRRAGRGPQRDRRAHFERERPRRLRARSRAGSLESRRCRRHRRRPALTGMVIAGEGFTVPLDGEWRAKIEETWEGARRREILPTVPIAQQFLLANSPVADLFNAGRGRDRRRPHRRRRRGADPPPAPAGAGLPTLTVALSVVAGR